MLDGWQRFILICGFRRIISFRTEKDDAVEKRSGGDPVWIVDVSRRFDTVAKTVKRMMRSHFYMADSYSGIGISIFVGFHFLGRRVWRGMIGHVGILFGLELTWQERFQVSDSVTVLPIYRQSLFISRVLETD